MGMSKSRSCTLFLITQRSAHRPASPARRANPSPPPAAPQGTSAARYLSTLEVSEHFQVSIDTIQKLRTPETSRLPGAPLLISSLDGQREHLRWSKQTTERWIRMATALLRKANLDLSKQQDWPPIHAESESPWKTTRELATELNLSERKLTELATRWNANRLESPINFGVGTRKTLRWHSTRIEAALALPVPQVLTRSSAPPTKESLISKFDALWRKTQTRTPRRNPRTRLASLNITLGEYLKKKPRISSRKRSSKRGSAHQRRRAR